MKYYFFPRLCLEGGGGVLFVLLNIVYFRIVFCLVALIVRTHSVIVSILECLINIAHDKIAALLLKYDGEIFEF